MEPGKKTIQGEIENWLEDYAPSNLIEGCSASIKRETDADKLRFAISVLEELEIDSIDVGSTGVLSYSNEANIDATTLKLKIELKELLN